MNEAGDVSEVTEAACVPPHRHTNILTTGWSPVAAL